MKRREPSLFERGARKVRRQFLPDLVRMVRRFAEDIEIAGDECKSGESECDKPQRDAELLNRRDVEPVRPVFHARYRRVHPVRNEPEENEDR